MQAPFCTVMFLIHGVKRAGGDCADSGVCDCARQEEDRSASLLQVELSADFLICLGCARQYDLVSGRGEIAKLLVCVRVSDDAA